MKSERLFPVMRFAPLSRLRMKRMNQSMDSKLSYNVSNRDVLRSNSTRASFVPSVSSKRRSQIGGIVRAPKNSSPI